MSEHIIQLPSGLTVAVEQMAGTRTAAIGVWVGVGSRDDAPEHAGMSHVVEHLLFKGTTSRSAIQISQAVDRVGGDINAYTSKEHTAYYCRLPARYAASGIELLGDILTRPQFRPSDIESERQVILEELAMDEDSPEDVVHQAFSRHLFPNHPLGAETAGDRTTVSAIQAEHVAAFHAARYRAANTVVSVAGAIDPNEVIDQIAKAFDDMPTGDGSTPRDPPGEVGTGESITDDTEQVHMVIGGRSLPRGDADRETLDVVNHVLGGGLSSRLFDEIRERRGLAYSVFSGVGAYADSGAWSIYAGTTPDHADEVRRLIDRELARMLESGITADELEIAVGYLSGSYEMGLEDSGARMTRLGAQLSLRGSVLPIETQLGRWANVTLADAQRVIERVFGKADPVVVTVGPR